MIQRPQSVLLGLIILLMLAGLMLPNWEKNSADGLSSAVQNAWSLQFKSVSGEESKTRIHLALFMLAVAGMAGFSISKFKNRLLQMKIGFAITLGISATLIFMMLGIREGEAMLDAGKEGRHLSGFYLLFIALFSNIISNRLIRKDENLVRSMDRIR
jgi:hypothetical protein